MEAKLKLNRFLLFLFVFSFAFFEWYCQPKNPGIALPNSPPTVHLANVPFNDPAKPDSSYPGFKPDSAKPLRTPMVKLHWVGNDPDGFVTAFMYRWSYKDHMKDSVLDYHPNVKNRGWRVLINYVTYNGLILLMDVDSADAAVEAPKIFKYLANTDLDPDKRNSQSPVYDPNLIDIFENKLYNGKKVVILGDTVYASNWNPRLNPYPDHDSPNSGNFILESNDLFNYHVFEITAIDNEGAFSRSDTIRLWNPQASSPIVNFDYVKSPSPRETLFVLMNTTYTWPGIKIYYRAIDKLNRPVQFAWRVDSLKNWSDIEWTTDVIATVTGEDIKDPYTRTKHYLEVRAKNGLGAISLVDSMYKFNTVYPDFAKPGVAPRLLFINMSKGNTTGDTPYDPSKSRITGFIKELLDSAFMVTDTALRPYDFWDKSGYPPLIRLVKYSSVFVVQDYFFKAPTTPLQSLDFAQYLDIGGNMVFDGVNYKSLISVVANSEALMVDHMCFYTVDTPADPRGPGYKTHTAGFPNQGIFDYNCIGAKGDVRKGYPDARWDTAKLNPIWNGGINNMSVSLPRSFGEIIYRFDSKTDSAGFENEMAGVRYIGITFKTVYLGFPLYYVQKDVAIAIVRRALMDVGQL